MARGGPVLLLLGLLTLPLTMPGSVAAQGRLRTGEARLLREAAARESRGDYAGAEAALRRLLEEGNGRG